MTRSKRSLTWLLAGILAGALTACATTVEQIRSEPPVVQATFLAALPDAVVCVSNQWNGMRDPGGNPWVFQVGDTAGRGSITVAEYRSPTAPQLVMDFESQGGTILGKVHPARGQPIDGLLGSEAKASFIACGATIQ